VSATCPHCHILLVEANTASLSDLADAVTTAANMGATQISNSYGGAEWSGETVAQSAYNHPGIAVTVSSGDSGFGVEYPAASQYVTAVGGTSLYTASNARGWTETAWAGAGSGCSKYISKPSWQVDTGCAKRAVADVSAVANPQTGLAVYGPGPLWSKWGGTSLASPVVAAAYALTGSAAAAGGFAYAHPDWFNDVTSGSNGSCTFTYLCTALAGFDGPTGIGTPASAHPSGPPPADGGGDTADTAGGGSGSSSSSDTASGSATPPASATPQPVTAGPAAPVLSSVSVSSSALRASRTGRITVRITCGGGPACSGVISLQARLRGSALRVVGKARYSVGSGKSVSVRVRLSRAGMHSLQRKHRFRVYGTARDSDGTTAQSSFLVRAPKQRKHRR
jgi:hypothetical protein